MLRNAKTIAVVGISDKAWRASHNIGRYLAANGYRVIPVNPALERGAWPEVLSGSGRGAGCRKRADRLGASTSLTFFARPSTCPPSWRT